MSGTLEQGCQFLSEELALPFSIFYLFLYFLSKHLELVDNFVSENKTSE